MNLSSKQLRAFVALNEERNFTKAAEQCHLSQPAFSALIRALEDGVGTRLFDRDTRKVQLTTEGQLFAESARRLLDDMDHILDDLTEHVERRKGRVSLAALPSLAAGWLPGVFAEFRRLYPGIEISLTDTLSDQCLDLVRLGKVDFALAAGGTNTAELATRMLCSDEFHLVCRKDNALARQKTLRPKDLLNHPFVHLARSSSVRQHLDALLHPLQMNTVLEVEHLATVMGMVQNGVGISVVPALTLFHFQHPNLMTRPLDVPGLTRKIYLVSRADRSLSVAAQALYDLAIERRPDGKASSPGRASRKKIAT
ncbi:LysR family transcriptional regulator [Variovorax terrae]|uniref:LysR family transcriptional regulator n=1 Tax=Variovorax terrae TaxID=2923278 RepID=A0A9X1VXR3_9BURK|nr:LysR family transcriptional regulator [Variovorax terrae]MCJ0765235.1 LysR family transcriptional regulator [Variovorax terrae]